MAEMYAMLRHGAAAIPDGLLRIVYMVGQDQLARREVLREAKENCIGRTKEAIERSRTLLERLRLQEEVEARKAIIWTYADLIKN